MVNARCYCREANLLKRFKTSLVIGGILLFACLTTLARAASTGTFDQHGIEKEAKNSPTCVKEPRRDRSLIPESLSPVSGQLRLNILKIYEKNGYRPVFLSNGTINTKAKQLIARLKNLIYDGIDLQGYHLGHIEANVHKCSYLAGLLRNLKDYGAPEPSLFENVGVPNLKYFIGVTYNNSDVCKITSSGRASKWYGLSGCKSFLDLAVFANKALMDLNQAGSYLDSLLVADTLRLMHDIGVKDNQRALDALLHREDLSEFLEIIEPKNIHYAPLKNMLKRLMEARQGFLTPCAFSTKILKRGTENAEILAIKKRLHQEGYYDGDDNLVFDKELEAAVRKFQYANGLKVDGIVGMATKRALNIPISKKIELVKLALAEFRTKPFRENSTYLFVNIPQFSLELVKDGKIVSRHKVIVGKAGGEKKIIHGQPVVVNQTPGLESNVTRVVFNPRWYVNKRILKELEAESEGDPDYYTKQGFVFLPPRTPGGPPRVYQKPGDMNALGRVKFEFPNRFQIYLHDTPTKHLFNEARRDFSHGCIRVENAMELAKEILQIDNNKALKKIERFLKRKNPTYVKLKHPIPIYVRYIPASTDENGTAIVFQDIYGKFKDKKDKVDNKTLICKIDSR